ncbi:MAG: hypothetical protein H7A51_03875 [Akkermansiaceae bacterium]|nr:hypothetical protein [Akkermansiaceae bacterium]
MSWIQENKFVAGLAGVTAVLGGAILYFGNSQGNAYDDEMLNFEDLKNQHSQLVKAKPYPDAQNLKARQDGIKEYEGVIADVRKILVGYQPGKLADLSPQQFSDAQVKMQAELRAAFGAAETELPEKCGFGFEKYDKRQASASATARLNFQLGAMQWLLGKLAETKPQALLTIRREDLDVEKGVVAPPQPARGGRGGRNRNQAQAPVDNQPFVLMPIELAFTTSEASLRDFLKEMANSKQYYYAIRAIRIRNEKQNPPTIKDANFPAGGGSGGGGGLATPDDPFGGIALPDDGEDAGTEGEEKAPEPVPVPKPAANGERILKQVLGSEKLNVYISLDILLIKGDGAPKAEPPASTSNEG